MESDARAKSTLWRRCAKYFQVDVLLTGLTLLFIAVFHGTAIEDRFILNLYYVVIAAAAYALVKRRALRMMAVVVSVAAASTMVHVYLSPKSGPVDPLLDPVVDLASWAILMVLGWRLAISAYQFDAEERRHRMDREIEEQTVATRAAALTCTSHEVRTPLAGILTITEMLLDESAGPLNETQREFVKDIDRCGEHLMSLVNDILDYAKAQAGKIQLVKETVALRELVDQCVSLVRTNAVENGVTISTQMDADAEEIEADPLRLKQVLINLLSNAVKYTPKDGLVRIQCRSEDDHVILSVRDTGRGFETSQIRQLFDPYYQATHGDQGIGTGLGLAITKHLVDLHDGSITANSVEGSGSLFSVRLPIGEPGDLDAGPDEMTANYRDICESEDAHDSRVLVAV